MSPVPDQRHSGFSFDPASGQLHHLDEGIIYLPWPSMEALKRRGERGLRKAARPMLDVRQARTVEAIRLYVDLMPPEVVDTVAGFPNCHWRLLVFAARCGKPATDLLQGHPPLGYMTAHNDAFRRVYKTDPMASAALLLGPHRRQVEILEWLGFPGSESVRKVLRKITRDALALKRLLCLREQIRDAACLRRLSHLPRITAPVLALAATGSLPCLTPRLIRDLSDARIPRTADVPRLVSDTIRLWRRARPQAPLPTFRSVRHLESQRDLLISSIDWDESRSEEDLAGFPLRGNGAIVPLDNAAMLAEEGHEQRNCLWNYTAKRRRRAVFFYRVLAPTRATLSITKRAGRWHIDHLLGPANVPVPAETQQAVMDWLRETQRRKRHRPAPGQPGLLP